MTAAVARRGRWWTRSAPALLGAKPPAPASLGAKPPAPASLGAKPPGKPSRRGRGVKIATATGSSLNASTDSLSETNSIDDLSSSCELSSVAYSSDSGARSPLNPETTPFVPQTTLNERKQNGVTHQTVCDNPNEVELLRQTNITRQIPIQGLRSLISNLERPGNQLGDGAMLDFEFALQTVITASGGDILNKVNRIVADEIIGEMPDDNLLSFAEMLARAAPAHIPAYTRFHCIVMCVTDQLTKRKIAFE